MADETDGSNGDAPQGSGGGAEGAAAQPHFSIQAQYVKDLSFENPHAPHSLRQNEQPKIELTVTVNGQHLGNDNHEVNLEMTAKAMQGDDVAFVAELTYGGVFHVSGFPEEQTRPVVFIECPRMLFPFARRVLADCTRDGGFPPLMLEPIDFVALYRQSEQARQQAEAGTPNGGANGNGA
jgi:preprotein translocase subunit SecB